MAADSSSTMKMFSGKRRKSYNGWTYLVDSVIWKSSCGQELNTTYVWSQQDIYVGSYFNGNSSDFSGAYSRRIASSFTVMFLRTNNPVILWKQVLPLDLVLLLSPCPGIFIYLFIYI